MKRLAIGFLVAALPFCAFGLFEEDLTLSVPVNKQVLFVPVIAKGKKDPQPLIPNLRAVPEPGAAEWVSYTYLVSGSTNQAVAYSAAGNLNPAEWTISFWVIGQKWDLQSQQPDMLWMLEGKESSARLERVAGGKLQLTIQVPKQKPVILTGPIQLDMSVARQIAVACGQGTARLFLDGREIGAAEKVSLKGCQFDRIVFGQAGLGAAENRLMRQFVVYKRALSAGEIARAFYGESRIAQNRSAAIIKTARKITIDGEVNEDEWRDATELTGLVGWANEFTGNRLLAKEQSRFYVTYDDANLYVAMISATPDKVKADPHSTAGMGGLLSTTKGGHDTDVDSDDCFEVNVVLPWLDGDLYRYVVNGINTTYDYTTGGDAPGSALKGIDINWEPKWEVVANKVDVEKGWRVEARLPFSDIKAPPPKPGDAWGFNCMRWWKKILTEVNGWVHGERIEPNRKFVAGAYAHGVPGRIVFQGAEGTAVQLDSIGKPDNGFVALTGRVVSSAKENRQIKLSLASDSGEVKDERTLDVSAGGTTPFAINGRIKKFTTNKLVFLATDAKTGEAIYALEIPVYLRQALEITSRSYPTPGKFKVQMDVTGFADIPADQLSATVVLRKKGGGTVRTEKLPKFRSYNESAMFDVKDLPPAMYEAVATVRHGGKTLITKSLDFHKQPLPEWFGNKIGISEEVPPPFKPIRVTNDVVRVVGREYQFKGSLFPQQITVLGKPLLRAPIQLVLTTDTGEKLTDNKGKCELKWTRVSDARTECTRTVRLGDYTIENKLWMEYDGFTWNELKISSDKKRDIKGVQLVIPYTAEFSDVINPYDYSLRTTGKLRPEGWHGAFRPVWVGNAIGGLQWLAECDGDWNVKDKDREIVVRNDNGTATMEVTFVDQLTDLKTPLPLPFALVATPVKEAPRDNRDTPILWSYAWYPANQVFMPGAPGWYLTNPDQWGFILNRLRDDYAQSKTFSKRYLKTYTGPYVTTLAISANTPDFVQFGDEWYMSENDRVVPAPDSAAQIAQGSKSLQDYFIWQYWKLYQNNPFAALYYDVSNESNGLNPLGGLGYQKRDGSWVPAYASLGNREIFKRLYTMIKLRHPDAVIKCHNSGLVNMAYMAFCDYFVEGECTINMLTQDKADYLGKIRPETYRAEMMGRNFGFVTDFLYQFTRSGMWTYDSMRKDSKGLYAVDHIMGLLMLHDCNNWDSYAPTEFSLRCYRALERHGWGPNYRMIPYWEQKIVASAENQFATFYFDDFTDKAICIFYNDSNAKGEQRLKLDWKALGFDDVSRLKAINTGHEIATVTKENKALWYGTEYDFRPNPAYTARIENGELVLPLMPYDYQMIVVWKE